MRKIRREDVWRPFFWVRGSQEMVLHFLNEGHEDVTKIRSHFPKLLEKKKESVFKTPSRDY